MWLKPNWSGLIILAAALPIAILLGGAFTTVGGTMVVGADGTVLEESVEFPVDMIVITGVLAAVFYPISMAVGRRIPTGSVPSFLRRTSWLLSIMPITFLFLLCAFVLYARVRLGFWPRPYHPDPKEIGLSLVIYLLLWLGLMPLSLAIFVWVSVRAKDVARSGKAFILGLVTAVLSWTLFIWIIKRDPGSFLEWLAD